MSVEALIPLMNNVPNSSIFEHLKKDSFPLQQLERDFKAAVGARSPQIYSFFELEKSLTAIKGNNGTWKLSGPSEILVEPSSATCGSKNQHPTNNRNHAELVKYGNQYEPIYNCIRVSLLSIVVKESRKIDGNREAGENPKNTCEWLLEDPQYRLWMNEPRGLFWIKGNPGAGKSVLMKFAVMRMNHENPGAIVLSFFLHGRGKILQKTPLGLFRALLNSMLKYFPQYLSDLTKLFEDREKRFGSFLENRWDWAEKELQEFMLKVLTHGTRNRPVIMFVDALDECGKDVAKGLLTYFKDIMEEIESNGAQVKICFSSRHYPILGHGTMPGISVEERNDKDIRSVIQRKFKEIEPEARRRQLEKDILLKAQGGFQWAVLVADMIADENATGTKAEKLIEKLASTPEDLEELYTEILSNATDAEKEQMVKLAQWILFSERPLSVQELRDALATDKEMTYTTVSELRSDEVWIQPSARFERYVTHISRGLVEFQTREVWEQYEPGEEEPDREAQFIHQSVADHMLNKFLSHSDCVRGSLSQIGAGHFQISRSCFKYLALKEVLEGDSLSRGKFSVQFPLAPYAVRFLFDHIKQVEQARVSQIDLLSLIPWELDLVSMKKFASIWRKLDPDTSHAPIGWPFAEATVLHILVALGSKTAFEASIEHYDGDMNGRDSGGYTPLLLAIRERHYDLALSLLDWSMNGKEHHRKSPPQDILMNDDDIPISRFVDVNTKNDEGETPLTVALTESAGDVIFKLIESGAELEYFGAKSALLHYTICQRDEKLLKKLIEKRFSLDGGVYFAVKELSKGEDKVLESFISRLLEAGADTTKLPDFNKSVEQGVRDEPDDELDDELDDESEDAADNQALILASGQGQTKIVNLLLSYGASPIYQNEHGDFPLMEATLIRHEKLIETLLQADPSAATMQDDAGDTSLHIAVKHGHKNIVEMLIQKGNHHMIELLQNRGLVSTEFEHMYRPLLQLKTGNIVHFEVIKRLVINNWTMDYIDNTHHDFVQVQLFEAAKLGHELIIRVIIYISCIDFALPLKDKNGQTLLSLAAENGHEAIVKLLLGIGKADPDSRDSDGNTPLSRAASNGHLAIVKLLLDTG
ncbi:ankyrin repeat protein, partial [Dendryphion nanum]